MTNQEVHPHSCSCGDKYINHAHEFPDLGCICLTCGLGSPDFRGHKIEMKYDEENNKIIYEDVIFDEDVVHNLKKMIPVIKKLPVNIRGDYEAIELMILSLKRAVEIIEQRGM